MHYITAITDQGKPLQTVSSQYSDVYINGEFPGAFAHIRTEPITNGYWCFESLSWKPLGVQPSESHVFNWQTKQWEDPRTLQDLKDAQWTTIKQARSQAEYAGFTLDGSTFDSDATSQQRITGAVTLAQLSTDFTIGWTLQDNTVRVLNQLDMLNVGMELGFHVATQFTKAQTLRSQIEAATTAAEVAAVVW